MDQNVKNTEPAPANAGAGIQDRESWKENRGKVLARDYGSGEPSGKEEPKPPTWNGEAAPGAAEDPRKVLDTSRLGERDYWRWARDSGLLAAARTREAQERQRETARRANDAFLIREAAAKKK